MRFAFLIICSFLISQILVGQIHDRSFRFSSNNGVDYSENELIFEPVEFEANSEAPFINFVLKLEELVPHYLLEQYSIRFSEDGVHWLSYIPFKKEEHAFDHNRELISALLYSNPGYRFFQLKLSGYNPLFTTFPTIRLFFEAHASEINNDNLNDIYRNECGQPNFQSRGEWCDTSECIIFEGNFTEVTHLVIHHSVGISESDDWAAVVRSIWHYHVDVRGWSDIGYNWLIAPNGVIYEGRLDNFVGAHFCGNNGGTMGVCMLGDYENEIYMNETSRNALVSLLAWKSFEQSIAPLEINYHSSSELNLNTICGHRNGCATLCPGQNLYSELDSIRNQVNIIIENCDPNSTENKLLFDYQLINTLALDYLRIELGQQKEVNYWIVDINGSKVLQYGRLQGNRINILDLVPGLYILRIVSNGISRGFKFIKLVR